jgi:Ser/Thr protein kinase RdoA (MazF antagonist)
LDYITIAKELLSHYSITEAEVHLIRHNENITLKVTDGISNNLYLLRIHKPSTEGLFGLQHTLDGIKAEILILQELNKKGLVYAQKPVANRAGEYITICNLENYHHPCYATVLEWIEGDTLSLEISNIKEIAFKLGQNLALFHQSLKEFKPSEHFVRPIYDGARIDSAIEELKYCVDIQLFRMEHYEIIKDVLAFVKKQIEELNAREDSFGIIHADFQLGNIILNEDNPCMIDLGFCGFGYYVFDIGSAATIFPGELRKDFLHGYASRSSFPFHDLKYVEGQIFMDIFISYVLFMRDSGRNTWITTSAEELCETLCKDFLEGKEVFYSL